MIYRRLPVPPLAIQCKFTLKLASGGGNVQSINATLHCINWFTLRINLYSASGAITRGPAALSCLTWWRTLVKPIQCKAALNRFIFTLELGWPLTLELVYYCVPPDATNCKCFYNGCSGTHANVCLPANFGLFVCCG